MDGFIFVLCCVVSSVLGYFFGRMYRSKPVFKNTFKTDQKRKSFQDIKWWLDDALVIDAWSDSRRLSKNDSTIGFFISKIPDVRSVEEYGYYLLKIFGFPIIGLVQEYESEITLYNENRSDCFSIRSPICYSEQKELIDQFIKDLGAFFDVYIKKGCPIIDVKLDSEVEFIVARAKGVEINVRKLNAFRYGIA